MNRHSSHSIQHQQVAMLLPWYINQSLEEQERQQVESHIRTCAVCRRDLVELDKLSAALKQSADLDLAAEASFAGLSSRLQTAAPNRQKPILSVVPPVSAKIEKKTAVAAPRTSARRYQIAGRMAIAASLLAMIPLTMQLVSKQIDADYYTLSAARPDAASAGQLRVVFAKPMTDKQIDAILNSIQGQRMDGPNSVGAYSISLRAENGSPSLNEALAALRNNPNVILAEPVLQP